MGGMEKEDKETEDNDGTYLLVTRQWNTADSNKMEQQLLPQPKKQQSKRKTTETKRLRGALERMEPTMVGFQKR